MRPPDFLPYRKYLIVLAVRIFGGGVWLMCPPLNDTRYNVVKGGINGQDNMSNVTTIPFSFKVTAGL
jgi:hypothetical protein